MTSNLEVATNFINQTGKKHNALSCSYSGHNFYSYATVVATLDRTNKILLVSYNGMSPTTAGKHLTAITSAVIEANNNGANIKQIGVPYHSSDGAYINCYELYKRFLNDIDWLSKNVNKQEYRAELLYRLQNFKDFTEYLLKTKDRELDWKYEADIDADDIKMIKKDLRRIKKLEADILNPDYIKEVKRQKRAEYKKQRKELKIA